MGNDIRPELNCRIKEIREDHGLSQRAFGEAVGISGSAITRIESNERNPSEQTLRMICSTYNVSRNWLEYGIEPKYREQSDDDWEMLTRMMEGASENKKKLMRILANMPDELLDEMMRYLESKR